MTAFGLTPRQAQILNFIKDEIAHTSVAPRYEDIAKACGLKSKSGASRHVHQLKERGHVDFFPNRARSISLVALVENQNQTSPAAG